MQGDTGMKFEKSNYKRMTCKMVVNGETMNTITSKGKITLQDLIDRLAELEDKIDNGTLVELPCKIL